MCSASSLDISAVLPCYEEAPNLRRVVDELATALERSAPSRWDIVLVSSRAARDGTLELARSIERERSRVRVIEQGADDRGYGRALALGISAAERAWVLLSDADGQFDHSELVRLAALTGEADVIVGYREARRDTLARRAASTLYGLAVSRLVGVRGARDVDCAFKLIRRELLEGAPLRSRTGAVNAELLARAVGAGGRLAELPVRHRARQAGTARFELAGLPHPAEAARMACEVASLTRRRWKERGTSTSNA